MATPSKNDDWKSRFEALQKKYDDMETSLNGELKAVNTENQQLKTENEKLKNQSLQYSDDSKQDDANAVIMRVSTWNMLAAPFAKPKWFASYCSKEHLEWNPYRRELFFQKVLDDLILKHGSDILSFQEVDCLQQFSDFFNEIKNQKYQCIYQQRNGKPDGLLIAYSKDKYDMQLPYYRVDYDGLSVVNDMNPFYLTHNIALIVILKCKQTGQRVIVANTHCNYAVQYQARQLLQFDTLLNCIECLMKGNDMIVMNGDFNCTPVSLAYKFVCDGSIKLDLNIDSEEKEKLAAKNKDFKVFCVDDDEKDCVVLTDNSIMNVFKVVDESKEKELELKHNLKLKSVYKSKYGKEPEVTNHTGSFHDCLDYIFVRNDEDIVDCNELTVQKDNTEFTPNKDWPSDHFYLCSSLKAKEVNINKL